MLVHLGQQVETRVVVELAPLFSSFGAQREQAHSADW